MTAIANILHHTIKFEDKDINFMSDSRGNPWFYVRDILKTLDYRDPRSAIKDIDKESKVRIKNLNEDYKSIFGKSMHPDTIFVNEYALYELVLKSKKKEAAKFRKELVSTVLPSIREFGYYEVSEKEQAKLKEINRKLKEKYTQVLKKNKILEYNMRTKKYPAKSVVYIVRPVDVDRILIKIGKTRNLETRMNVINNSLPNHAKVLYYIETDHIDELERLIKVSMKQYVYKTGKEYYKISVSRAKIIFDKCFESLKINGISRIKSDSDKIKELANYVRIQEEIRREVENQGLENECDECSEYNKHKNDDR